MKTQKQIDTEIMALSERMTMLETRLGIKTVICAGYCGQPTANRNGMCLVCQDRDYRETKERNRR